MTVVTDPAAVLAGIPGWEQAEVRKLDGGLTNRTYLVQVAERRAVLKVDSGPRETPYNRREEEAGIQRIAATQGLANRVLFVSETVYLTEYLDGEVWSRISLDDGNNLVHLGRALSKLHSLPLTGRLFDARSAARNYAQAIGNADPHRIAHSLQIIDAMPRPHNLCCCHNDLVAANIIATPAIRFLDWEYACDNDPVFDLATVVAHHRLSKAQANLLVDAYFDGDGNRWQAHLSAYVRCYDALHWLWSAARQQPA